MGQSKSQTQTSIPEWQEQFVTGTVLPQAQVVAGQEFTPYGGDFAPEMSGYSQQAGQTLGGIASMTPQDYQSRVQANLGGYQQNVIDATLAQMQQQREQQRVGEEARMIGSGAFDSSRRGVYEGERQAQYELGRGNMIANLLNQGYQQALGTTAQQIGQQQAAAGGLMGVGGMEQALGAADIAGQRGEFLREQGFPAQKLGTLMGVGMGDFGRTTTETYKPGLFDYLTLGTSMFA